MATFNVINGKGEIVESSMDGAALFARLSILNAGPGGPFTIARQANGLPEIPVRAAPVLPAAAALAFWVEADGERLRQTPAGLYRRTRDGFLYAPENRVLGAAPTIGLAEQMIATFEASPNPADVSTVVPRPLRGADVVTSPPVTTPTPAPVRQMAQGTAGVTVNEGARTQILREEEIARRAGFALARPYFPPGTDMMQMGLDRFATIAKEHAALPDAFEAAIGMRDAIRNEQRVDRVVDASTLRVTSAGELVIPGGPSAPMTRHALEQLLGRFPRVFPSARQWALEMGVSARAAALNDGFERLKGAEKRGIMLRTRTIDGAPQVFATVGRGYTGRSTDGDQILGTIASRLKGTGARAEALYDRETTRIIFRWSWNKQVHAGSKTAVGTLHNVGGVATSRDDAMGKWRCEGSIIRVVCINCTIAESRVLEGERVHRGSGEAFLTQVSSDVGSVMERAQPLLDAWRVLGDLPAAMIVDDVEVNGADEVFNALLDGEILAVSLKDAGIGRDLGLELLLRNHKLEPGDSMQAIANAITRAAHDRELDAFQRLGMERAAGVLIPALASGAEL